MELKELKDLVRELAILNENDDPFVSCYLNINSPERKRFISYQSQNLRKAMTSSQKDSFDKAISQMNDYLQHSLVDSTKGIALFCRAGDEPFFKAIQFFVPMDNWMGVDTLPNIYHLIEMKDTYHRYVIVLSNKDSARILEVNLGAVTEAIWTEKPELRERVGREWTKMHYHSQQKERTKKHFKEKMALLDRLMSQSGHTHLILAGHPESMNTLEKELPKHLKAKLVDLVKVSPNQELPIIVAKTLEAFIHKEQSESHTSVDHLKQEMMTQGLAVAGSKQCMEALQRGQADLLIIDQEYKNSEERENLVRLATLTNTPIETVKESQLLHDLGGVGCLLRYKLPYQMEEEARKAS